MNYSNSKKYNVCLNGTQASFLTLNSDRVRKPTIGVNAGIEIVDCECSTQDYNLFENYSVGRSIVNNKIRFEMPFQYLNELKNHPYTEIYEK
jgi:hypothetical protein